MTATDNEKTAQSHSEQQARAQVASIAEMVQNLTREGAAELFCAGLSDDEITAFIEGVEPVISGEKRGLTPREHAIELINSGFEPDGWDWSEDSAREAIQEDPLSVQVRDGWHLPGDEDDAKPEEFEILLCAGGPAVRIRGELDQYCQPTRAWIEHQDWGTGWQQLFNAIEQDTLLTYCQQFYYGE